MVLIAGSASVHAETQQQKHVTKLPCILQLAMRWVWVCRYAGRGYEREEDVGRGGTLLVKGLKSMWRQAAPIVRNTLQGALRRIIMQVPPISPHPIF